MPGERAFVAGADIKGFKDVFGQKDIAFNSSKKCRACFSKIERTPGWSSLPRSTAWRSAADANWRRPATFRTPRTRPYIGVPEVKLGLNPGAGGTQRLGGCWGRGAPSSWCCRGDFFTAQDAFQLGLLEKVVPAKDVLAEAKKLAGSIISNAPLAVEAGKKGHQSGLWRCPWRTPWF